MGNCNSQGLARTLEDKCSSSGSRRARGRRSSSSSSTSSPENTRQIANKTNSSGLAAAKQKSKSNVVLSSGLIQQQDGKVGASATNEYDRSKVIVIDTGTDVTSEEANLADERLEGKLVGANNETISGAGAGATTTGEVANKSDSGEQQDEANKTKQMPRRGSREAAKEEQSSKQKEKAADDASTTASKLEKLKEGLDFIETEEDVKAVEAATLKIQSTFRGKKFRSKLTPASKATPEEGSSGAKQQQAEDKKEAVQVNKSAGQQQTSSKTTTTSSTTEAAVSTTKSSKKPECSDSELSKRIGAMQVNDNNNEEPQIPGGLSEDEAERAATKIQAGFKGYKTRKELEGKLPAGSAGGAQQAAPSGCQPDK